ncbi:transcription factor HES-7.1-B-like [Lates japonicus]|uniref:Transcription factor HES-7.1-B-like protein n=1 Tax=Lates japonicus TaxID=270547 RepID=A0AAD3NIJ7_LATJO|nr:transcription factor HES-7.1-B-like protein [Lates japonicus]GLD48318.1 transcription factor HES-7.1-B-like protein [Lates japonicus]GLD75312.1 transcription factor HES-7.1-B-like protein [Lates japonicus]GLD75315.1 transcription factor HES-7.1-B-like protein [Lates japonicus]
MKALSSPESPRQRTMRRVSKPLMEKRRRERINHSLETLRLLMLESTHNEKLKNPKVEKAEILESVVHFLKTEKEVERVLSGEQTCARQHNYHDGMRSCLLRVSRFIATKSQESEGTGGDTVQASLALPGPHTHPSSPGHIHKALTPAPAGDSATQHVSHHRQHGISHPYLTQTTGLHCETRKMHITDPVWRPWPQ